MDKDTIASNAHGAHKENERMSEALKKLEKDKEEIHFRATFMEDVNKQHMEEAEER